MLLIFLIILVLVFIYLSNSTYTNYSPESFKNSNTGNVRSNSKSYSSRPNVGSNRSFVKSSSKK